MLKLKQAAHAAVRGLLWELSSTTAGTIVDQGAALQCITNAVVHMYARCDALQLARQSLERMRHPDVVSWTSFLSGYGANGECEAALQLFMRMRSHGCTPNAVSIVMAIKACSALDVRSDRRQWGKLLQRLAVEHGCATELYVQTALITMHGRCGKTLEAERVFSAVSEPNVVAWNALLACFVECGEDAAALSVFSKMRAVGCLPSSVTFVLLLKACTSAALKQGNRGCRNLRMRVHMLAVEAGYDADVYVHSALVNMYSKLGCMPEACLTFETMATPSAASWTALILGFAKNGDVSRASQAFARMMSVSVWPDSAIFAASLKACVMLLTTSQVEDRAEVCLDWGRRIHSFASSAGCDKDPYVQSALVDMYAKCGKLEEAYRVFVEMRNPDVVPWTSLVLGYAERGEGSRALNLFHRMRAEGCDPDEIAFLGALRSCTLLTDVESGCRIEREVSKGGLVNEFLLTCLVDFHAKCGSLGESEAVFDSHPRVRDIACWNTLLTGLSHHVEASAEAAAALGLFEGLRGAGLRPDDITFTGLLTCCNHAGLAGKAKECFDSMQEEHGMLPSIEHCNCMVDAYGRCSKLEEAMVLVRSMQCSPNAWTWMTVLGACRRWHNLGLGKLAFGSLVSLDAEIASAYVLMAHLYASHGLLEERDMVLGVAGLRGCCKPALIVP